MGDTIQEHNSGNHTWKMGINQFSDLTPEEFERIHLGYITVQTAKRTMLIFLELKLPMTLTGQPKVLLLQSKIKHNAVHAGPFLPQDPQKVQTFYLKET